MKPRGIETQRLVEILQGLQLARKTGVLAVERPSANDAIEQGTLTFSHGHIVDATLHPYQGTKAFEILASWTNCYFTFHPSSSAMPATSTLPQIATDKRKPSSGPLSTAPYRVLPVNEALVAFPASRLSRLHRQLFLLVNGERTLHDFIRLTGHLPEEVETLLLDLERAGFIRR
jgi:hypothetical protein